MEYSSLCKLLFQKRLCIKQKEDIRSEEKVTGTLIEPCDKQITGIMPLNLQTLLGVVRNEEIILAQHPRPPEVNSYKTNSLIH
jgi:hypothetical protein